MTVEELREALHNIPGDRKVLLSIDPDGNGFRGVEEVDVQAKAFAGGYGLWDVLHPDDVEEGGDHADVVVIWP